MVTERSHILKQTCNFQLQFCLSMGDDFLLPSGVKGLKKIKILLFERCFNFIHLWVNWKSIELP